MSLAKPLSVTYKLNDTPEKIWHAISDKEVMKQWYFDIPDFVFEVGAIFNFYEPGDKQEYHHRCTILEIIPNQKFEHTWTYPTRANGISIVTWQLVKDNQGTIVTLTHAGLENFTSAGESFARSSFEAGWNEIIGKSLKEFVEQHYNFIPKFLNKTLPLSNGKTRYISNER